MAKRTRGSSRPGQRRSAQSRQPRPAGRPSQGLSAAEEARAAELESQIVARERESRAAIAQPRPSRDAELARGGRPRTGSPLAVRAAEEYGYVSRDVRRIIRIGGSMLVILAIFGVLIDILHVVTL